jgi:hypothetical protein
VFNNVACNVIFYYTSYSVEQAQIRGWNMLWVEKVSQVEIQASKSSSIVPSEKN